MLNRVSDGGVQESLLKNFRSQRVQRRVPQAPAELFVGGSNSRVRRQRSFSHPQEHAHLRAD